MRWTFKPQRAKQRAQATHSSPDPPPPAVARSSLPPTYSLSGRRPSRSSSSSSSGSSVRPTSAQDAAAEAKPTAQHEDRPGTCAQHHSVECNPAQPREARLFRHQRARATQPPPPVPPAVRPSHPLQPRSPSPFPRTPSPYVRPVGPPPHAIAQHHHQHRRCPTRRSCRSRSDAQRPKDHRQSTCASAPERTVQPTPLSSAPPHTTQRHRPPTPAPPTTGANTTPPRAAARTAVLLTSAPLLKSTCTVKSCPPCAAR